MSSEMENRLKCNYKKRLKVKIYVCVGENGKWKMEMGEARCSMLAARCWIVTSFSRKLSSADLLKADSNES